MNLKSLSDGSLLESAKQLVQEEREVLTKILHHLREIERRRLFCDLKYKSLHEYAVGELKYSDAQAGRRIAAMRLLKEVPEIEERITDGSLSLSNLAMAQTLFLKEKKAGRPASVESKREVLFQLENQTTRAAEKIVAQINPEMAYRNNINFDSIKDDALREKLLAIKGRMAHTHPNMTLEELLHVLADNELEKLNKSFDVRKPAKAAMQKSQKGSAGRASVEAGAGIILSRDVSNKPSAPKVGHGSKAEVIRQVRRRDEQRCSNCGSNHALQIDHKLPKAAGGLDTTENLRLLCRTCNQRAAIRFYGQRKMERHLD
jgi:hypothetical protein